MQYFYSHGFHSSRDCQTYKRLCRGLDIAPSQLVYDNGADFYTNLRSCKSQLQNCIESNTRFGFIGNSLGAFYLWQLTLFAPTLNIPTPHTLILFNPVLDPLAQLKKYINQPQINTTTHQSFTLTYDSWASYAHSLRMPLAEQIQCIVCLSLDDELIDVQISKAYWQHYARIITNEGGHIITDFVPFKNILAPLL